MLLEACMVIGIGEHSRILGLQHRETALEDIGGVHSTMSPE